MRAKYLGLVVALGLTASLSGTVAVASGASTVGTTATGTIAAAPASASVRQVASKPRPGKPNRKWTVPLGAKFNNPMVEKNRFVIERHILKAIRNTPRGEKITISAYSLDRQVFADELIRAYQRGVRVKVLLNDHIVPSAQVRIQNVIGAKTTKASFLYRCKAGCRADRNEYNNLHSKFYLFSRTGRSRNVVMLGSQNMTLNAVRWQWNDLFTTAEKPALYAQYIALFNDMRPDWDKRRATYTFCDLGDATLCPAGDQQDYYTTVFPRHSSITDDVVLDILNNIQCVYTDAAGVQRTSKLALSMHTMRGNRGDYIADKLRDLYAQGCNLRVNYGLVGFHTKQHLGAPTPRGRMPLRSTGFNLVDDEPTGDPEIDAGPESIERYTHHKYFMLKGSYRGVVDTKMVWTGSTNWASLGTPQDEILVAIHGGQVYRQYKKNFNLMWRKPFSRNAYTTTYSSWRMVGGFPVLTRPVLTVEPDRLRPGSTWESD